MIRKATKKDLPILAELAVGLWPDHTAEELGEEFSETMAKEDAAFFLKFAKERAVGFAQVGLRRDYVEGTEFSPVGYLEGIYVAEDCRGRGIAKALLHECEIWAKGKGCREFASDCELDNTQSLGFHLRAGFAQANRIICFTKRI